MENTPDLEKEWKVRGIDEVINIERISVLTILI